VAYSHPKNKMKPQNKSKEGNNVHTRTATTVAFSHPKNKMKAQNKIKEVDYYAYLNGNCGGQ